MEVVIISFQKSSEIKPYMENSLKHYNPCMKGNVNKDSRISYKASGKNSKIEILCYPEKSASILHTINNNVQLDISLSQKLRIIEYVRDSHIVTKVLVTTYK